MKKKRTAKKYNPKNQMFKRFQKDVEGVWLAKCWSYPELLRGGINYDSPHCTQFCDYFLQRPYKWQVFLASFSSDGVSYWTDISIQTLKDGMTASEIAPYMTEQLQVLADSRNSKFYKGSGWYATPNPTMDLEGQKEEIEAMFKKYGAFGGDAFGAPLLPDKFRNILTE